MRRIIDYVKNNRFKVIMGTLFVVFCLIITISNSFAVDATINVAYLDSTNPDYNVAAFGSFGITERAEWISANKVKVTYNIESIGVEDNENIDLILIIDNSTSMSSYEFGIVKDTISAFLSGNNNKVALFTFDEYITQLSYFSDDSDRINKLIDGIETTGKVDYYKAFKKFEKTVESSYNNSTKLRMLFVSASIPSSNINNDASEFEYFKNLYPNLKVSVFQFNANDSIAEHVSKISDKQYYDVEGSSFTIMNSAFYDTVGYDKFSMNCVISDYYTVDSTSVDNFQGDVSINGNSIVWDFGKNLYSGTMANMSIVIDLKDNYKSVSGSYKVNSSLSANYSINSSEENISTSDSPILANTYKITYLGNAPSTCNVLNVPSATTGFVYSTINVSNAIPNCLGYQFKGWEVTTTGVKKISESSFVMPAKDVTLTAVWTKVSLTKSMDGEVYEKSTLYNAVREAAKSGGFVKKADPDELGPFIGNKNIYYYYGAVDDNNNTPNNNVVFGGFCWQIVRTTSTGGVKLLYNGEVDENGSCLASTEHMGFTSDNGITFDLSNYDCYYGTDYIYDKDTQKFTLSGTLTKARYSETNYNDLIGKYTCESTNADETCDFLHYVIDDVSTFGKFTGDAYVMELNSQIEGSFIGKSIFNIRKDADAQIFDSGPGLVGYMYNARYNTSIDLRTDSVYTNSSIGLFSQLFSCSSGGCYASDSFTYADGKYTLKNSDGSNVTKKKIAGFYTCGNSNDLSCETLYYALSGTESIPLSNGVTDYKAVTMPISKGITKNSDGTYNLDDMVNVSLYDWYNGSYDNYKSNGTYKYYTCYLKEYNNDGKCVNPLYIIVTDKTGYDFTVVTDKYKYGNSFTWDGEKYTLTDTVTGYEWHTGITNGVTDTHHYTCFNDTGVCEKLFFVFYYNYYVAQSDYPISYIILNNGESIEDALNNMLFNSDVNSKDSVIKMMIDDWYKRNLLQYTEYLEDTVWCNNRNVVDLRSFNPNGESYDLYYGMLFYEGAYASYICPNELDRFTVSSENGNGALTYPIGLITSSEYYLSKNGDYGSALDSIEDTYFYTMSPSEVDNEYGTYIELSAEQIADYEDSYGVRPAISLKPGIKYESGDGSASSPYVITTE